MNATEQNTPKERAGVLLQALEAFEAELEGRETLTGAEIAMIDALTEKYRTLEEPGEYIIDSFDAIMKGIKLHGRPGIEFLGTVKDKLGFIRRTLNA